MNNLLFQQRNGKRVINSAGKDEEKVAALIRVMVVEQHPVTRAGIRCYMENAPEVRVVGEASGVWEALRLLEKERVDVVLMDLNLPDRGGLELIRDIRVLYPCVQVLVFTMFAETYYAPRALKAGARGYLLKTVSRQDLLQGIQRVLAGEVVVSEGVRSMVLEIFSGRERSDGLIPESCLSDRELHVLSCLGDAKGTRGIAKQLGISVKTVESHRLNIRRKLGIGNSLELQKYAVCWQESRIPVRWGKGFDDLVACDSRNAPHLLRGSRSG